MKDSALIGASPRLHARLTGLVGVLVLVSGSYAGWIASRLVVRGDATATADHLAASGLLARLGIAASLLMMVAWVFYALLLHRLLRPAGPNLAASMLSLVVVSAPIYMLNQLNQFGALRAASAGEIDRVELFLDLYRFGNSVAAIFFALWLVPLGLLVWRSGFLPRPLGGLLLAGSPGYLVLFVQSFFFPGSERTLWTDPFLLVTHLAELALLLWLVVRGVDAERWPDGGTA